MKLESIALHHGYEPDPTTHAAAVRISAGIEHIDDIIADVEQALEKAG